MAPRIFSKAFTEHPASVGETYTEHFLVATRYSRQLAMASLKALIHALVPGLCCTSASDKIRQLNDEIVSTGRGRLSEVDDREALAATA